MLRFTDILFSPLGNRGNPAAVRRVAKFAAHHRAVLTIFGVVPEPSRMQRALHRSAYLDSIREAERKLMQSKLARCTPKSADLRVMTRIETGDPALSIIDQVAGGHHDLVVVTTDEDDDDHATIKRLLRQCPCPVWVIRPTRARVQRVLAAVNPDPAEAELNRVILTMAASMVDLHGGELHLVHAWDLYGEATMRSSAFIQTQAEEIESMLETERTTHESALDTLLVSAGVDDEPWQIHLRKGRPADVVSDVVERQRINLLVMGTVARTGVSGLLIGNTAESVLDTVRCSVIAVKPPEFGSSTTVG